MAIQEVFVVGAKERKKFTREITLNQLQAMTRDQGMIPLREDGLEKVAGGLTTMDEVIIATLSQEVIEE